MINYVVASSKDWYKEYPKSKEYDDLNIIEIKTKADLNLELLEKLTRVISFSHIGIGRLILKFLIGMNVLYSIQLRYRSEEAAVQFKI